MNKIWFKRKLYGWGWTPCSTEGWLVMLVWAIAFVSIVSRLDPFNWFKNMALIFISVGVLLFICYKKGEKPKWQWGKRKED